MTAKISYDWQISTYVLLKENQTKMTVSLCTTVSDITWIKWVLSYSDLWYCFGYMVTYLLL